MTVMGERGPKNTSTTPLGSSETFTGGWELNHLRDVMVSVKADSSCTLFFDFSNDGVNADSTFPVGGFNVASGIHEFHAALKGPRYFRCRIVNGDDAQTYMRLYTYYGDFRPGNTPLNQSIGLDSDAIITRPTDPQDEIRIGRRPGVVGWTKFGNRTGLTANSGDETVWQTTGNFTPQSSAETYDIAYNTSTDGAGTTGATAIAIYYIDANGNEAIALHTLGSDGSDTTSFTGYGINRVAVSSSGSANVNGNDITLTGTTSGLKAAVVAAGKSVTEQSIFTMGANSDGVMKFLFMNVGKPGGGNAKVRIKAFVYNRLPSDTTYEIFSILVDTSVETTVQIVEPIGFALSPTDVVFFTADTDTNNAEVTLRFSLNTYQRS